MIAGVGYSREDAARAAFPFFVARRVRWLGGRRNRLLASQAVVPLLVTASHRTPAVIATTVINETKVRAITPPRRNPILYSRNMSLGINLLLDW